jgi:hypothetical protein
MSGSRIPPPDWSLAITHCVIVLGAPQAATTTALQARTKLRCDAAAQYAQTLHANAYLVIPAVSPTPSEAEAMRTAALMGEYLQAKGISASRLQHAAASCQRFFEVVERVLRFITANRLEHAALRIAAARHECRAAAIICSACRTDRLGRDGIRRFSRVRAIPSGESPAWFSWMGHAFDLVGACAYWRQYHPISPRRAPVKALSS